MKKNDITNLVQVGKAVLTPQAIKRLEIYQTEDDLGIDGEREIIADAVCFIGKCLHIIDDDCYKEAHEIMSGLSHIRDSINELKKS